MEAERPGQGSRAEIIERLYRDRRLAHEVLFAHRHPNKTAPFQGEMIDILHSTACRAAVLIAFRESAKSTYAEEAVVLGCCFREIRHAFIVGASFDKAAERLHSIRRQFENNRMLEELFGDLKGQPWGDDRIELSTGQTIQAMGRGQAIRGTKAEDVRPDYMLCDDIEDSDDVRTPEAREKVFRWFFFDLLPAGDTPTLRVRVLANDTHPECLANKLEQPRSGFLVKRYPWEYPDPVTGARTPTWPDRYNLEFIDTKRAAAYALGRGTDYESNYMCRSSAPADRPFRQEMFRIAGQGDVPVQVRTWQPVYAMFDPARTVNLTSAATGYAAFSWIANRLVVWDAWARLLLPDEIVKAVFDCDDEWSPVQIGVEEDGLNEFLLQPLRHEQLRRGTTAPIRPMRAPRGKVDFIRGMQPFFNAREVIFAKPLPDLQAQLLSFPTGRIDAPNALAYALKMRPGAPVYDDFTVQNVAEELAPSRGRDCYLAVGATGGLTVGILLQLVDGSLRIFADWLMEGEPSAVLRNVVAEANLAAGRAVELVAGPMHFDQWNNVGLTQAARKLGLEIQRAPLPELGRPEVRSLLRRQTKGMPCLMVAARARWVLNGFSGGYARAMLKHGVLAEHAEEGQYRTLMEALESFCGLIRSGIGEDDADDHKNYATTHDGRRFISARVQR